ncbi:hypothetical protein AAFM46_16875 (plasmid) [Arthrobacter sp. TMP15]|uniref:hypothetical protein n=1 Tax=Arthrobacter sp. TMP15 TaxID=3140789 RepID=UPI0031BA352D
MSIPFRDFSAWLQEAGMPHGTAELAALLGMKRTTLQNQKIRGRMTVYTVISAARAAGLNPLDVLGQFPGYTDLIDNRLPVTSAELLSQLTHTDVLVHLLSRVRADFSHMMAHVELSKIPNEESVRTWIDAIDPGDLRRKVTERSGIAPSNFSAQLTDNRLTPELAILISRLSGVSSANGLVVSGVVTPEEAGWPLYGRDNALSEISDIDLIDLASDRLTALRRLTKKKVDVVEENKNYLEALG